MSRIYEERSRNKNSGIGRVWSLDTHDPNQPLYQFDPETGAMCPANRPAFKSWGKTSVGKKSRKERV